MIVAESTFEKYFDDGVVQYWRLAIEGQVFFYRIRVQPSCIAIDRIGYSWNKRFCWQQIGCGFKTFQEAAVELVEKYRQFLEGAKVPPEQEEVWMLMQECRRPGVFEELAGYLVS